MNNLIHSDYPYSDNPHYKSLYEILRIEAESIISGTEDTELLRKNAELMTLDEVHYRQFLLDMYYGLPELRALLMEKYIHSVSMASSVKQYCDTKTRALHIIEKILQEK